MFKIIMAALSVTLLSGTAGAQQKLLGDELGIRNYTEVEWTLVKDKQAYGFQFRQTRSKDTIAICSRPGKKLGNFEIQVIMSDGSTMQASKMKNFEAEDRVCKIIPKDAKGLMAKKPVALDWIIIQS